MLGLEISEKSISLAVAHPDETGQLKISACYSQNSDKSEFASLLKEWVDTHGLVGADCHVVLPSSHYKIFPLEKPAVDDSELVDAVRWKVKDLLDYPIEEAAIDVYEFPKDALRGRPAQISIVCSRSSVVQSIVNLVSGAGLNLLTIDIIDLAIRNHASRLVETEHQSAAILYLRPGHGTIVLVKGDVFYFSRHFEFSLDALNDVEKQDHVMQNLALEVQRSFDYFDSQMAQVPPQTLYLMGPAPNMPLANMLGGSIAAQVKMYDMTLAFGEQHKTTQEDVNGFAAMGVALKRGAD